MKLTKKLLAGSVAVATLSAAMVTPVQAEVSASVGVSNMYLWRGYDLGAGQGTPAVSGDLTYSNGGFYSGVWGSSGDATAGTEFDLYAGYGAEFGAFSVDASFWNYVYPNGAGYLADEKTTFGKLSDFVLSVGFGPVSLTTYQNVAGASGYNYTTLGVTFGAFGITAGHHNSKNADPNSTHLNLDYAYNDNLTFTLSQFLDNEPEADKDLKFVVAYSLPIE